MAKTSTPPYSYRYHSLHGRMISDGNDKFPDKTFLTKMVGRSRVTAYLRREPHIRPLYVKAEERLKLPTVSSYSIRIGSPSGIGVGWCFHSPLQCRIDSYYVLYYRSQFDPHHALLSRSVSKKKYEVGPLFFYLIEDDAILITRLEENRVTEMLEM